MSPSEVPSSNAADRAAAVPGWVQANAETLVGVPLRILLIVLGAMLVRALAKRAIARAVERILQPAEGKGEPRRSPRGPRSCSATRPGRRSGASSGPAPSGRCSAAS
ncbi:hypothetical protein ACFQXA_02025 [Nocardiopsis composta]